MAHAETSIDLSTYFATLSDWWHESTDLLSSPSEKASHPAYLRIIDMGESAVPFILGELASGRGGDWYIALRRILGFSPVAADAPTTTKAVREAWLAWGRTEGLI